LLGGKEHEASGKIFDLSEWGKALRGARLGMGFDLQSAVP
jgi:hypothetical protein